MSGALSVSPRHRRTTHILYRKSFPAAAVSYGLVCNTTEAGKPFLQSVWVYIAEAGVPSTVL